VVIQNGEMCYRSIGTWDSVQVVVKKDLSGLLGLRSHNPRIDGTAGGQARSLPRIADEV
jgi:hypothetical protein